MRKTLSNVLVLGLSLALLGCPPADEPKGDTGTDPAAPEATPTDEPGDTATPDKVSVDISHVKVGQKYTYHMVPAPGAEMDMIWEVTAITDSEVKYRMTSVVKGKPVGEPTEQSWAIPAPVASDAAKADPGANAPAEETITLAGMEWDCWVVESDGVKTWAPKKNGLGSFPSFVKQAKGDQVTNELTKIE
jgi:hypothetical protein